MIASPFSKGALLTVDQQREMFTMIVGKRVGAQASSLRKAGLRIHDSF
jgi:hypothetical protein